MKMLLLFHKIYGLKITNLGPEIIKCGFPTNKLDKYKNLFELHNLKYEIIENDSNNIKQLNSDEKIIKQIKNLDLSTTTPMECFNLIYNIQKNLK